MPRDLKQWFDYLNTLHPSLEEWLTYIEGLHPEDIKFGLDRVSEIAERIELIKKDPDDANQWQSFLPGVTVVVTGTNGKGSTVALLEAIYRDAGYKVGAYTSPHLHKFNERLKIDGQFVENETFCRAFEVVEAAREGIELTWFEFTALACIWLLQQAECDVCLLEVGAGGRKDVVNCVNADLSIITNVELDHCQWLGNDREAIGREKAGIMRPGKPVIFGDKDIPTSVLKYAQAINANLLQCQFSKQRTTFSVGNWQQLPLPQLPLPSAACAVLAVDLLPLEVSFDEVKQALIHTSLPGRWQKVAGPCEIIMDVAHNPAATQYLAQKMREDPSNGKTYAVFGLMADKDIDGVVAPLTDLIDQWCCVDIDADRPAKNSTELQEKISSMTSKQCYHYPAVANALQFLLAAVQPQDRILVFGSFYTVADAGQFLMKELELGI